MGLEALAVPAAVWSYTKRCVADAIGIGFASHHYEFSQRAIAGVRSMASSGSAVVIGLEDTFAPRDAALLNGTLVHGLDFDDTHMGSVVHCSASAVPMALAIAAESPLSGKSLLLSVLMATEIDARLGSAAGGTFQQLGFHPTGVVGIFGAAVAAVRLLGGSVDDAVRAQGIALSMAGGSMAFLDAGAWTKRLHPGWAAQSALAAAKLALAGFEAPSEAYAGRYGFFELFTRDASHADRVDWKGVFEDFAMSSVAIKPYPICHFNHASVDAALALRRIHQLEIDDVDSITIGLHERQFGVVVEPEARKKAPDSEYEAKFSAAYAVAAALVRGELGLRELDEDSRSDPRILDLAARIGCEHDERSQYPSVFSGGVRIQMKDGSCHEHFETVNRGAEGRLLSEADVKQKFVQNCRLVMSAAKTQDLWDAVMGLDTAHDCSDLLTQLRGLDTVPGGTGQQTTGLRRAAC